MFRLGQKASRDMFAQYARMLEYSPIFITTTSAAAMLHDLLESAGSCHMAAVWPTFQKYDRTHLAARGSTDGGKMIEERSPAAGVSIQSQPTRRKQ